jgi:hypothetical protein
MKVYLIIVNWKIQRKLILDLYEPLYVSLKYGKVVHSLACLINMTIILFIYLFIKLSNDHWDHMSSAKKTNVK